MYAGKNHNIYLTIALFLGSPTQWHISFLKSEGNLEMRLQYNNVCKQHSILQICVMHCIKATEGCYIIWLRPSLG